MIGMRCPIHYPLLRHWTSLSRIYRLEYPLLSIFCHCLSQYQYSASSSVPMCLKTPTKPSFATCLCSVGVESSLLCEFFDQLLAIAWLMSTCRFFLPQDRGQWKRKIHAVDGNSELSCKPSNEICGGPPSHHELHCRPPHGLVLHRT